MINFIKKWFQAPSVPQAFLRCFIVLPGCHTVPLEGIDGISLELVERAVWVKHQGLKYWVAAYSEDVNILSEDVVDFLARRARLDLFNLMFFKRIKKHKGFTVSADGTITENE
jgi:hypothetical protein